MSAAEALQNTTRSDTFGFKLVGMQIANLRKAKGLTQNDLGIVVGMESNKGSDINPASYREFLSGESNLWF